MKDISRRNLFGLMAAAPLAPLALAKPTEVASLGITVTYARVIDARGVDIDVVNRLMEATRRDRESFGTNYGRGRPMNNPGGTFA